MTDIVEQKIGSVGTAKLSFEGGKLKLAVGAEVSAEELLTILENAIPGDLDNKIIDGLKLLVAKFG